MNPFSSVPPCVLVTREEHILLITINRPEARNAVNLDVHMGIGTALEEAELDPTVRAVIITGAGDQAFCAGADLKAIARGEKILPEDPISYAWGFAGYVSHPISKPTIAAVNGFALGGGTEIVLASDLAVAAETASFGLPEVKRGIYAGAGGAFRLAEQIPRKLAMEFMLTGEPFTARRALELGFVNVVAQPGDVLAAARTLANRICINAPLSVQATKRIAVGIVDRRVASDESKWRLNASEGDRLMRSEDAKEGPRAFAERRAPQWQAK